MITFKQHIDIFKSLSTENGLSEYMASLPVAEKVDVLRGIKEVYPLKYTEPKRIYEDFNVYDNVMDLVLGQFIMLEQIITGKTTYSTDAENDLAIAELIIRPKTDEVFDNDDKEKERKNREAILNYRVDEVHGLVTKFLGNRNNVLFKQFSGVFYQIPDEDEEEDEEHQQEATGAALFEQQWYWYSIVRMLAKEDITKYGEIYMLKMDMVMPEMSYLAQKSKIESAENRKRQALNKL